MPLFSRRNADRSQPPPSGPKPMASGRHLSSSLQLEGSISALDAAVRGIAAPPYQHMPALAPAGHTWLGGEPRPAAVLCFSDDGGYPVMATFWSEGGGTRSGLFPLGSGDERLQQLPVIGHWKRQDPSLSSIGTLAPRQIRYEVPVLPPDYFANILILGGAPISDRNQRVMSAHVAMMFKLKAQQFISSENEHLARRFVDSHEGASPQQVLADLGDWNNDVIPYIQDIPGRVQGLLLGNPGDTEVWKQLERY